MFSIVLDIQYLLKDILAELKEIKKLLNDWKC